jgi:8-hydroxy-5-deazaflavin:NADPH oxidoreductase
MELPYRRAAADAIVEARFPSTQRGERPMDVTIIGTGNMARGIAARALAGGHAVTLLGTEEQKARDAAAQVGGDVRPGTVGDDLAGDIVVLAVPYGALGDVLGRYRDELDGRVVVDITNPVDFSSFTPLSVDAGSAAQEVAAGAPGARVVKAFNTTFAGTLAGGEVAGQPLDVFVAADDEEAKGAVAQLVGDGGMRAVDAGPLARARELEALGYLHMALQQPLGTGFASAVKVLA